ncbi:MAG: Tat-linked quality control protein TatD, partial [Candidatus Heimdallarchaeota archaeon AB_125]
MYIDTHLHLCNRWCDDIRRPKAIADIDKNKIVTWAQSWDIPSYMKALEYSKESKYVFPAFGVLPWEAFDYKDRFDEIAKLCEDALMLGEIGWDERNAQDKRSLPYQKPMLEMFLEAAEKHNLIMNLHFRGGLERDGFELLKSYDSKKAIIHAYSGPPEMIKEINDQGFYISYGSSRFDRITPGSQYYNYYKNRVQEVHEDRLINEIYVLEKSNFRPPSKVFPSLLQKVAEFRNTTPEEIEAMNQRNVLRLIGDDPKLEEMRIL